MLRGIAKRRRVWTDSVFILTCVVLVSLGIQTIVQYAGRTPAPAFRYFLVEVPLYFLALFALFRMRGRILHPEERRFWNLLTAGFATMVVASTFQFPSLDETTSLVELALEDALFLLGYFWVLWAVELRPDRRPNWTEGNREYRIRVGATTLGLAALFCYFIVIPVAFNDAVYRTFVPSFGFFVAVDAVLAGRLLFLGLTAPTRRWRSQYLLLAGAVASWFFLDLVEMLDSMGFLDFEMIPATGLVRVLPYFMIIVATLVRERLILRSVETDSIQCRPDSTWVVPADVIGLVAVLTAIHLFFRRAPYLGEIGPGWRDLLVVVSVSGLLGLCLVLARIRRRAEPHPHREITIQLSDEQFAQSRKMEALGRLAGGVAHDFNNLLTVMRGYSDLLGERLGTEDSRHEYVGQITRAVERSSELTHQLLAFSRNQILHSGVLDLSAIVRDSEPMLRRTLREDVELLIPIDPDPGRVKADLTQMTQVILNLAINASEAMPDGGQLEIGTANIELELVPDKPRVSSGGNPYVLLFVRDSGCGIDERTRSRLFEPFFTTKHDAGGTGLGLATVYGIVKQSGGHIMVDSVPGQGSTFSVYLPRVAEAMTADVVSTRIEDIESPTGETILIAEDEAEVRKLASDHLRGRGYRVLEAADGQDAIEIFERHSGQVDILLADVVMPRVGGQQLAHEISALYPGVKIVFMSGYLNLPLREDPITAGRLMLAKPFSMDDLDRALRQALNR